MITPLKSAVAALFEEQLRNWDLARENYAGLQNVKIRSVPFKDYRILVQFNPKRIISSDAKVDPQSISKRPCFLCGHNRPSQQIGIPYDDDFVILVNPYPVFNKHLTIPMVEHQPQFIQGGFGMMLQLARDLDGFTIIYNGPECGASAPDHFHFQAIQKGVMPIETDISVNDKCLAQGTIDGISFFIWNDYLRKLISMQGNDKTSLEDQFRRLYGYLAEVLPSGGEPMMNMLATFYQDSWTVHIFPRRLHRPKQFFEQGDKQLLLSPASIDMGGVLIMPREEDFNKISKADIEDIFGQVCVDDLVIQYLVKKLI